MLPSEFSRLCLLVFPVDLPVGLVILIYLPKQFKLVGLALLVCLFYKKSNLVDLALSVCFPVTFWTIKTVTVTVVTPASACRSKLCSTHNRNTKEH